MNMPFSPETSAQTQEAMGAAWSTVYDDFDGGDVAPIVDQLFELVGKGAALELGVGTGRIAVPLAQRGAVVTGLDASADMLAVLAEKDAAGAIVRIEADMADPAVSADAFDLVYVVNNTLSHVLSQARQMACVFNAARSLKAGGQLLVEGYLPAVEAADQAGEKLLFMNADEVRVRYAHIDAARQTIRYQIARMRGGAAVELYPMSLRYIWPSELDVMAMAAGLRLVSRTGGWQGEPFEGAARRHVSTYIKSDGS